MEDSKQHLRHLPKIKKGHFCQNCGETLEEKDNFCPTCGQLNDTRRITFENIVRETLSDIFAYDSRFLNSLIPLFTKPGQVTLEYIKGKRTFHIHPIRLYFIVSFVFFFMSAISSYFSPEKNSDPIIQVNQAIEDETASTDQIVAFNPDNIKERENLIYQLFSVNEKSEVDTVLVNLARKESWGLFKLFLIEGFEKEGEIADEVFEKYQIEKNNWNTFIKNRAVSASKFRTATFWEKFKNNFPLFALFFLPIFAGFINLLLYKIDILYYEHLMFVFHIQSVFFIIQTLDNIIELLIPVISGTISFVIGLWFIYYLYKSIKTFYGLRKIYQNTILLIGFVSGYAAIALILFSISFLSYLFIYSLFLE